MEPFGLERLVKSFCDTWIIGLARRQSESYSVEISRCSQYMSLLYKKSDVNDFYFFNKKLNMLEIVNNRVFVDGVETINPTLIGYALLDFAEGMEKDGMKIVLKDQDVFVESLITEV